MKPNLSLRKTLSLLLAGAGVVLLTPTASLGQSPGVASPTDPKVTICYSGRTILVSQATANALIGANLAYSGPCTNVINQQMCYRGRNISVSPAVVNSMLSAGATLGLCSGSLVGSGDGKSTAVAAAVPSVGSSVTPSVSPLAALPPSLVTPAVGRPNSPVQLNEVEVCYKGHTLSVMPTAVQTYLAIGGKLGSCSQVSALKAESDAKPASKKSDTADDSKQ